MGPENAHSGTLPIRDYPQTTTAARDTGISRVSLTAVRNRRNPSPSSFFGDFIGASVEKSSAIARRPARHFSVSNPCTDDIAWLMLRSFGLAVFYLWAGTGSSSVSRSAGRESHPCAARERDLGRLDHGKPGIAQNVRRGPSTKLTLIGSEFESRTFSPLEVGESCKSSPTRCPRIDEPCTRRLRTRHGHPMQKL